LEKGEFQVELRPGEEKEISGKVLPRHRQIQMIDGGLIKGEDKANKRPEQIGTPKGEENNQP
jgi:hypothetical protein